MGDTDQVYRVVESFSFDADGRAWVMKRGDLIDEAHPAFAKAGGGALLEQVSAEDLRGSARANTAVGASGAMETATAGPGEKRTRTAPKG